MNNRPQHTASQRNHHASYATYRPRFNYGVKAPVAAPHPFHHPQSDADACEQEATKK